MENMRLVEKVVIKPDKPSQRQQIFLSNIDLTLVVYQDSVSFFDPPNNKRSFLEAYHSLCRALGTLLVVYNFLAGRLVQSFEDSNRFEIDCNDAGVIVAAATTDTKLSELGELLAPKPEFRQFVAFSQERDNKDKMDMKDQPLLSLQLTQLGCGSLALGGRLNHCTLDGIAVSDFQANLAALTRGDKLVHMPNADRTLFRARNPPEINHPHYEYARAIDMNNAFSVRGMSVTDLNATNPAASDKSNTIYLSPQYIASIRNAVLKDRKLKSCTTFEIVAAKIWKARCIATKMPEEKCSTMLFPVDVRKRMIPQAPKGFAGNALVPCFARAPVKELKEAGDSFLVKKVQEGLERLDNEYVRSGIDWLEVNRGVPCREDSFSVVAWWKLGLDQNFSWGRIKCSTSIVIKPGIVMLLPRPTKEGGLSICLELPEDQRESFCRSIFSVDHMSCKV